MANMYSESRTWERIGRVSVTSHVDTGLPSRCSLISGKMEHDVSLGVKCYSKLCFMMRIRDCTRWKVQEAIPLILVPFNFNMNEMHSNSFAVIASGSFSLRKKIRRIENNLS